MQASLPRWFAIGAFIALVAAVLFVLAGSPVAAAMSILAFEAFTIFGLIYLTTPQGIQARVRANGPANAAGKGSESIGSGDASTLHSRRQGARIYGDEKGHEELS